MDTFLSNTSKILVVLIKMYQCIISRYIYPTCRFYPSCSQYAIEVLNRFNLIVSIWLILKRLFKCHPLHKGGKDNIPIKN
ncbi:membrane protein insertion efficiency factor YidD [Buchnera aphidicola (Hormaphis cornu)]|nr:membrane protein insertion efficiency factor YidD [Buchnera aphidicola (Hormaphis cornu)]